MQIIPLKETFHISFGKFNIVFISLILLRFRGRILFTFNSVAEVSDHKIF